MNKHPACFNSTGSSGDCCILSGGSPLNVVTLRFCLKLKFQHSAIMMPHNKILPYVFRSLVDQYFGGTFECELKCTEAEDEPPSLSKENFLQLSCFISQDMRYMLSGLRSVSNHSCCLHDFYICIVNIPLGRPRRRWVDNIVRVIKLCTCDPRVCVPC